MSLLERLFMRGAGRTCRHRRVTREGWIGTAWMPDDLGVRKLRVS